MGAMDDFNAELKARGVGSLEEMLQDPELTDMALRAIDELARQVRDEAEGRQ